MTVPDGIDISETYPDIVTQLLERMSNVEKIATEEAMQGYVNTYLEAHPADIDETLTDPKKAAPADVVGELKEDLGKLDESVKKKIEPNKTTFFDYVEKIHESANLFNVQDTTVNSDGLTITIKDGNIKCEGVYNLSYNKSIDTGARILERLWNTLRPMRNL